MAAISSNGTGGGNWNAGASWGGGVVPVGGDTVTILAGDTITVNVAGCECGIADNAASLTLNGTLKWSRAANCDLTIRGQAVYTSGSVFDMGTAASPIPAGVTAKLILGKNNTLFYYQGWGTNIDPTTGGTTAFGAARARVVTLTGAVTAGANKVCPVSDATGWQVGDVIVFPQTTSNDVVETEVATITVIAGLNVTVNTLAYSHAANCKIGNLSSNVVIQGFDPTNHIPAFYLNCGLMPDSSIDFEHVLFLDMGADPNGVSGLTISGSSTVPSLNAPAIVKNCAFYRSSGAFADGSMVGGFQGNRRPLVIDGCAIYAAGNSVFGVWFGSQSVGQVTAKDCLICAPFCFGGTHAGQTVSNCFCCVTEQNMVSYSYSGNKVTFLNCTMSGRGFGPTFSDAMIGPTTFDGCDFGVTFGFCERFGDRFMRGIQSNGLVNVVVKDCKLTTDFGDPTESPDANMIRMNPASSFIYTNKNNDPTKQEFWGAGGQIVRDDAVTFDGSSPTWQFRPLTARVPLTRTFQVLAPYSGANPTLTVVSGWIKREAGIGTTKVTLSGLGIAPSVYTCTGAAGVWEQFVVSATQVQGSSGVLDVTVEVGFGAGTPKAWVANISAPLAVAADTGKFNFWYLGQPVPLVMANNVGALDVMNVLLSQLTLPASVGKAIAEMFRIHGLEAGTPLEVMPGQRKAGAAIVQTVADSGGKVTVTRA